MKKYTLLAGIFAALFWGSTLASDVYITQAGSTTTIDITQTGDSNRVGSAGTASTITGDGTDLDLTQTGDLNTADIAMTLGTSGTILNYNATGGSNVLNVEIDGATDTSLTTTITGDSNEVTLCGTMTQTAGASQSATCATGVQANATTSVIDITGSSNKVALGLDAPSAVNTITIGGNVASSSNVINLSQTGLDIPVVTLNVDGASNAINIIQQ